MKFTLEQKEQITLFLSRLYQNINRANAMAIVMEFTDSMPDQVRKAHAREAKESTKTAVNVVDQLKSYLMGIDSEHRV